MTGVNFTVPVTFITRTVTGEDSRGNDVYTETSTFSEGVFAPTSGSSGTSSTSEVTDGRDQVTTQPIVFLPEIGVTAYDVLIINGLRYEVDGEPLLWPANPFTGWRPDFPLEVSLKRVTG